MSIVCGKCAHVRGENENVPDWQCPACGVAYNKVKKIQEAASPQVTQQPAKSSVSKPVVEVDENVETKSVIIGQQYMLYGVLLPFVVAFLFALLPTGFLSPVLFLYGLGIFAIFIMVLPIVGIVKILSATGRSTFSKVLHVVGFIIPLVNLFILFSANTKANTYLKHHGYDVGALGPRENFLNAPKFYGILFICLFGASYVKTNKATNPVDVAKSINAQIKAPVAIGDELRFDGVSSIRDTVNQRDLLLYKYVLLAYDEPNLSYEMGQVFSDDMIKQIVCPIQNLHKNLTGTKEKYGLRANLYNKDQALIKQLDFELVECRAYRK